MKAVLKALAVNTIGYSAFLRAVYRARVLQARVRRTEFGALTKLVPADSLIFDIGSNIGYTVHQLAKAPGARVVAVEPDADNLRCLHATVGRLPNVTVVPCAVGSEDGSATLSVPTVRGVKQHALGSVREGAGDIALRSIDSLRRQYGRVGMLKIDVEGLEGRVLDGMGEALRDRPLLHVEICGEANLTKWAAAMNAENYEVMQWQGRGFAPTKLDHSGTFLLAHRNSSAARA